MRSLAVASRSFSKHPQLRKKVLELYPDAKFNDKGIALHGKELITFLQGCSKAITALEKIDENVLSQLPDLEVIGKYGVGLDMLDLHAMNSHGVLLGWQGGVNKRSVSELVISFSISLLHRAVFANNEVKSGKWYQIKGSQLSNKKFGIIGCGHIGKDLVKLLQPFECDVFSYDILDFPDFYKKHGVVAVELDKLLQDCDVISLHVPLDESTKNILSAEKLGLMKESAVLINFARGGLIDEKALKERILSKKIAGVALDVFDIEPPVDEEFAFLENVVITPHIGGSSEEAILTMGLSAIESLENAKEALSFLKE